MLYRAIDKFFDDDSARGIFLIASAIPAMVAANLAFSGMYEGWLGSVLSIQIIALVYTADLKVNSLQMALVPLALMVWLNMRAVHRIAPLVL